jgi:hypothetical protein
VRNGADQEKSPVCADTSHALAAFNGVAAKDPVPVLETGAAIALNTKGVAERMGVTTTDPDDGSMREATGADWSGTLSGAVVSFPVAGFAAKSDAVGSAVCTQVTREAKSAPYKPDSRDSGIRTANGAAPALAPVRMSSIATPLPPAARVSATESILAVTAGGSPEATAGAPDGGREDLLFVVGRAAAMEIPLEPSDTHGPVTVAEAAPFSALVEKGLPAGEPGAAVLVAALNIPATRWRTVGGATDTDDAGVGAPLRWPIDLPGTAFIFDGAEMVVAACADIGRPAIAVNAKAMAATMATGRNVLR